MKNTFIKTFLLVCATLSFSVAATAAPDPDRYPGDTAIYTQRAAEVSANVLFVIDNSAAAANIAAGSAYDPSVTYTGAGLYLENGVYAADNQGDFPTTPVLTDVYNFSCADTTAKNMVIDTLTAVGTYSASGTATAPNIKKGKCDIAPKGATYAIGNYLNYLTDTPPQAERVWELNSDGVTKMWYEVARKHFSLLWLPPSSNPTDANGNSYWTTSSQPATLEKPIEDYAWQPWHFYSVQGLPQTELIYNAIRLVTGGYRFAGVNFGAMEYGANNKGGQLVFPISTLTDDTTYDNFLAAIPQDPATDLLSSNTARPATGTFMDAIAYFKGEDFPIISKTNPYPSPITLRCQPNFIIYITNGMNNENLGTSDFNFFTAMRIPEYDADGAVVGEIGAPCGDVDQDGSEESGGSCDASYGVAGYSYLDDMATYMRNADMIDDNILPEGQHIKTGVVQAFTNSEPLLESTGAQGGLGTHQAFTANELAEKLGNMLENIVREANASFIAPVVPASPENRVRSGRRIYLGFFKPTEQEMWRGNLKKYIINSEGEVLALDANGDEAPWDQDGTQSLWSAGPDVNNVEKGGTGELLLARATAQTRHIYTFLPSVTGRTSDLRSSVNAFSIANKANLISPMEVSSTNINKVINFIHGRLTLADTSTPTRDWVLGDVLHSKPNIFNYNIYDFSPQSEVVGPTAGAANSGFEYGDWANDCSTGTTVDCNKTVIFVGANDGMLHAFADHNGEELWGYVPPNLLPYLQNLSDEAHDYYVDGTPIIYSRDQNKDGDYNAADGDRVILMFGTRRGGGLDKLNPTASRGAYHALDVSDPTRPKFLFAVSSDGLIRDDGSGVDVYPAATYPQYALSELGETWSTPFVRRISVGGVDRIAMFIGAGYDNNEDLRWGSTQNFPLDSSAGAYGAMTILPVDDPSRDYLLATSNSTGTITNPDGTTSTITNPYKVCTTNCGQIEPRGRGVYVVEIARIATDVNGVEYRDFSHTGEKIWGYTHSENHTAATNHKVDSSMTFSFPADMRVIDKDDNDLADRIYAVDTGGRLWRFDIGDTNIANWTAKKVFSANPGEDAARVGTTNGRKFFYSPEYDVVNGNQVNIFLGSGDRTHPLNYLNSGDADGATLDRLYMVKDFTTDSSTLPPTLLTDSHMVDLTDDPLQDPLLSQTDKDLVSDQLENVPWDATTPGKYGWFIDLLAAPGEKALSPPQEILGLLLQTTYAPNTNITDPCEAGNQGSARFYALKALTGEAFLDLNGDGTVDEADRNVFVGGGIPPEPTLIVTSKGVKAIIISEDTSSGSGTDTVTGSKLTGIDVGEIETIVPVYWMQW